MMGPEVCPIIRSKVWSCYFLGIVLQYAVLPFGVIHWQSLFFSHFALINPSQADFEKAEGSCIAIPAMNMKATNANKSFFI